MENEASGLYCTDTRSGTPVCPEDLGSVAPLLFLSPPPEKSKSLIPPPLSANSSFRAISSSEILCPETPRASSEEAEEPTHGQAMPS